MFKRIILVLGILVVAAGLFLLLFFAEYKSKAIWQNGKVIIAGKDLQLPCKVDYFESTLNTKIFDKYYYSSNEIKNVSMNINNEDLIFSVYLEKDYVIGIMLRALSSEESFNLQENDCNRNTANQIEFPGNVTIDSDIKTVKKLYRTNPFNIFHNYFSEQIANDWISSTYSYKNNDWAINISTRNDEIVGIDYYYIGTI